MVNRMKARTILLIAMLLVLPGVIFRPTPVRGMNTNSSPDGIYLVVRMGNEKSALKPLVAGERMLEFDSRLFPEAERQRPDYFVVAKEAFIPLELAAEPGKGTDDKGKMKLNLQLAKDQVGPLKEFTEKHTGRTIAIVIGDRVVTSHKIRMPITDGRFQITWCKGNACRALYVELQKNVRKGTQPL